MPAARARCRFCLKKCRVFHVLSQNVSRLPPFVSKSITSSTLLSQKVYIARDEIGSDKWRKGAVDGDIDQRALADHLKDLASAPAERLDGQAWGAFSASDAERANPESTFEVKTSVRGTSVTDISVKNDYNTFAPYRCGFTADSSADFSVSPDAGTMNRRSGEPIGVVVRFSPTEFGEAQMATLVFETEDMKKVWTFIGSTG